MVTAATANGRPAEGQPAAHLGVSWGGHGRDSFVAAHTLSPSENAPPSLQASEDEPQGMKAMASRAAFIENTVSLQAGSEAAA